MDTAGAALKASAFAAEIRNAPVLYPAPNITDALTVLAFFALMAAMDLDLLRAFGGVPPTLNEWGLVRLDRQATLVRAPAAH